MKTILLIFVLVLAFAKTSYCFENHTIENASNVGSDVPQKKNKDSALLESSVIEIDMIQERNSVDPIFNCTEQNPEFVNGGGDGLIKFIAENRKYPQTEATGRVFVRFVVSKDGSVINPTIVRGINKLLDDEAIRVVKTLPKFKPAMQNGKSVNCWYVLPIPFDK